MAQINKAIEVPSRKSKWPTHETRYQHCGQTKDRACAHKRVLTKMTLYFNDIYCLRLGSGISILAKWWPALSQDALTARPSRQDAGGFLPTEQLPQQTKSNLYLASFLLKPSRIKFKTESSVCEKIITWTMTL
jgi:hypothetical protein